MNDNEARASGVVFSNGSTALSSSASVAFLALNAIQLVARMTRNQWSDATRVTANLAAVAAVPTLFTKPRSERDFIVVVGSSPRA